MTAMKLTIGGAAEACRTCRWVEKDGYCGNGNSKYFDNCASDNVIPDPCPDYEPETAMQTKQNATEMRAYGIRCGNSQK